MPTDATQKVLPSPSRQFDAPERRRDTRRVITPLPPPLPIQQPNTRNATFMSRFSCWHPPWRHEEGYYPPPPLPLLFSTNPTQETRPSCRVSCVGALRFCHLLRRWEMRLHCNMESHFSCRRSPLPSLSIQTREMRLHRDMELHFSCRCCPLSLNTQNTCYGACFGCSARYHPSHLPKMENVPSVARFSCSGMFPPATEHKKCDTQSRFFVFGAPLVYIYV